MLLLEVRSEASEYVVEFDLVCCLIQNHTDDMWANKDSRQVVDT